MKSPSLASQPGHLGTENDLHDIQHLIWTKGTQGDALMLLMQTSPHKGGIRIVFMYHLLPLYYSRERLNLHVVLLNVLVPNCLCWC